MMTALSVRIIGPEFHRWNITNESDVYQVAEWGPELRVEHANWRAGRQLNALLLQRGIDVPVATSGIGMVGYYSGMEVVDLRGLTDRHIARLPVKRRGMPGHEKWPSKDYLVEKGVVIVRWEGAHSRRWRKLTMIDLDIRRKKQWNFLVYDLDVVQEIARAAPEVKYIDFAARADRWVGGVRGLTEDEFVEDSEFIEFYYVTPNPDYTHPTALGQVIADERRRRGLL